MADSIRLVSPNEILQNPENPRLVFRPDELDSLERSIKAQGILVPLTVYEDSKRHLIILDGERRWRCARRLGLLQLPVIVQPEPTRMQNVMMMFAIHNARQEWDPLPTAYKLRDLEGLYFTNEGRYPNEGELAELASTTRGEVRRLKNILSLPQRYLDDLLAESEKPRTEQLVTVDHVLEATRGAAALRKQSVLTEPQAEELVDALVEKFKSGTLRSTVEPRQLAKIARGVSRSEVTIEAAKEVVQRLISEPAYTIDEAFKQSAQEVDTQHNIELQATRLAAALEAMLADQSTPNAKLGKTLTWLRDAIQRLGY